MKFKENKKAILIIFIPVILIIQFYLFKAGIINPMVKGADIEITSGEYIKDIDKFIIMQGDELNLSMGNYIKIPSYAKEPNVWFNVLDKSDVVQIKDGKLVALKEGYSSIAIMKNSRVLKKASVMVVKPKVRNFKFSVHGDLDFVGDTAKITTNYDLDYDKFKSELKPKYTSSDRFVAKVVDGKLKAVGVGSATITAKCGNKTMKKTFHIRARVSRIDMNSNVLLQEGEKYTFDPNIITHPIGLKHPRVRYEIYEMNHLSEENISLDDEGNIVGLKEGAEKVLVSCGGKKKIVTVNIIKKIDSNDVIKNLECTYTFSDDKASINLKWDFLKDVYKYTVYCRDTSKSSKFTRQGNIELNKDFNDNKVVYNMNLNVDKEKSSTIQIYVVGVKNGKETKSSDIFSIKKSDQ